MLTANRFSFIVIRLSLKRRFSNHLNNSVCENCHSKKKENGKSNSMAKKNCFTAHKLNYNV